MALQLGSNQTLSFLLDLEQDDKVEIPDSLSVPSKCMFGIGSGLYDTDTKLWQTRWQSVNLERILNQE